MVCCCDPFEPLGPEEMHESAEMIKDVKVEKASKVSTKVDDAPISLKAEEEQEPVEMEELLVSGTYLNSSRDHRILELRLIFFVLIVVLPPGVYPGQKIEVRSPDGSRTVDTIIPAGLNPGQAFLVKFPPTPKKTLKLQGSLASVHDFKQDVASDQVREEVDSERSDGQRDDSVEEVDQSPSFVQVLEDFLTPKPDPDVIEAMEKARREAVEAAESPRKAKPAPTPEGASKQQRSEKSASLDAPCRMDRDRQSDENELRQSESAGELSTGSRSVPSVVSSHIKKVEGEAIEANVTRVAAEPVLEKVAAEPSEKKKDQESQTQEELYSSSSFVKSLEEFFTPKPDVVPPKAQETVKSDKRSDSVDLTNESTLDPPLISHNQKLVLVYVPRELPPGATIYVEIPGENRTVAAQVPPGVRSFHVAYTPQPPMPQAPPPPMMASAAMVPRQPLVGREKLLSVRVPPGTLPGTTLHISVPNEPGRILAAQVPPGNVRKFHVSYIPREPSTFAGSGMLPPANPYQSTHPPMMMPDQYSPYYASGASFSGQSHIDGQSQW